MLVFVKFFFLNENNSEVGFDGYSKLNEGFRKSLEIVEEKLGLGILVSDWNLEEQYDHHRQ